MSTDYEVRFKIALVATELETSDAIEKERLSRSIRWVSFVSDVMKGKPSKYDLDDDLSSIVPLIGIWMNVLKQEGRST